MVKTRFEKLSKFFHISITEKEKNLIDSMVKKDGYQSQRSFFIDNIIKKNSNDNQFIKIEKKTYNTLKETYDFLNDEITLMMVQRTNIKKQMEEFEKLNQLRCNIITGKQQVPRYFDEIYSQIVEMKIIDEYQVRKFLNDLVNDSKFIEKVGYMEVLQKALVRKVIKDRMKEAKLEDSRLERLFNIICGFTYEQATIYIKIKRDLND